MARINEIMDRAGQYLPEQDLALIQKAYVYSAQAHAGQTRLSGEPYLSHPLEVAGLLAELKLDAASISAGLLHDTVEDTKASLDDIEELFGEEVADIVDGVTKISMMSFDSKEAQQAENIRKMIMAMAEDIRVVLVKLCDRLHNMRTLGFQSSVKRLLIAQETMDIYAPLSNRLGLHRVKIELEDLSLKYLKPDVFEQLKTGIDRQRQVGDAYIEKVINILREMITENEIKGRVLGRRKHLYSVYHKMLQQDLRLEEVHDLVAFRVVVQSLKDCYAVLGLVHALWRPIPGRFKDYISMPKANMYQSLHTTVVGPEGERMEIQIRTEEMNQLAEYGVAAHWQYKEKRRGKVKARDVDRFTWLRQIMDWQRELNDPREFMATLRIDLFQDEVYVFTPKGQVKELPEGATPIDFAYLIHTEVGQHCAGAKINGRLVPLETPLKNGDTIEIITDPHRTPSHDWLKIVKTAKARTRIKHFVRTEERARAIVLGKEMMEKEGRKVGVNVQKALKDGSLRGVAEAFSLGGPDDLFSAVGYSKITPRRALSRLMPRQPERKPDEAKSAEATAAAEQTGKQKLGESIRIQGVDNVLVRFAGCCAPLPGEPIVGYVSRGRGVTVHSHDCPNLENLELDRLLSISWEGHEDKPYPAGLKVMAKNVKGVLGNICILLGNEDVNIDSGSFHSQVDGKAEILFNVEVKDSGHLYRTIEKISKLENVYEVQRRALVPGDPSHL